MLPKTDFLRLRFLFAFAGGFCGYGRFFAVTGGFCGYGRFLRFIYKNSFLGLLGPIGHIFATSCLIVVHVDSLKLKIRVYAVGAQIFFFNRFRFSGSYRTYLSKSFLIVVHVDALKLMISVYAVGAQKNFK